jgi:hypothetical protein
VLHGTRLGHGRPVELEHAAFIEGIKIGLGMVALTALLRALAVVFCVGDSWGRTS